MCSRLKMVTNSLALLSLRGASNLTPLESRLALVTYCLIKRGGHDNLELLKVGHRKPCSFFLGLLELNYHAVRKPKQP